MIIITVDELQVIVTANTAGLTTAMSKVTGQINRMQSQTNSASSGMQRAFSGIGNGIVKVGKVAIVAGAAILGALGGAIIKGAANAAAAQKKLAQMDAVLKSTGGAAGMTKDALLAYADAQSKVTTFSKGTVISGENLMLTFTGIGKKVFPQAMTAAEDMSTALGTDLNSSVMMLGKAMNDPVAGMGRLTRSGVVFTAQQKEQVKALTASGDKLGAQKIILAELAKEFGGSAAAAAKTFEGQLIILKNALDQVTQGIGVTLMPYLTQFLNWVNSNMPAIQAGFKTAFDAIGKVVKVVADIFVTNVIPVFNQFKTWVTANMPIIKSIVGEIMTGIGAALKIIWDIIEKYVLPPLGKFLTWVGANMPQIKAIVSDAMTNVQGAFKTAGDWITANLIPIFNKIKTTIDTNMPTIQSVTQIAMDAVKLAFDAVKKAVDLVVTGVLAFSNWCLDHQTAIQNMAIVVGSFALAWGLVNGAIAIWNVVGTIGAGVTSLMAGATTAFGLAVAFLTSPIFLATLIIGSLIAIGVLLWKNWDTIKAKAIELKTAVVNKFNEIKTGITTTVSNIKSAVVNKFNEIKSSISTVVGNIKTAVVNKFNEIRGGASTAFNNVKSAIMTPINSAVSLVQSAVSRIKGFFSGMHISLPHISLPHFSLSGKFSLVPPSIPKIGVSWYQNGGVFDKASMIGVGENGSEAVVPLERNLGWVDKMASKITDKMGNSGNGLNLTITNFVNNRSQDVESLAEELQFYMKRQTAGGRG